MGPGRMSVHVSTLQVAKRSIIKANTLITQVAVLQAP
jgi:hypothetical protein